MPTRSNSVDPRAERVRAKLRDAALALVRERPVDQLTVGDIVKRAGVSRQVFYRHFIDRDDAIAYAFTAAFASATADIAGDARARIVALFDFAADQRSMYRNVVPSAVTLRVVAAFRAELAPACDQIAAAADVAGPTTESVSRFLVGGLVEVLRSWMEDPTATNLRGRVTAALDTVGALLGTASS
ncbi:TetR/AcrR family transcriptional regulator [Mycobacterium sp. 1274761.0]|uniref:TetR/AcrR family transcriptional regulator n=1 Tax=Mycobacterium sp. 1274761.0 TaxID=1834077 RepID=UPI0007FD9C58|nr:helix-turn-helix domain-containing protein [Mycobacterium sp. 1274761.0]OBK78693.1 TetR family transcriptional regulator [Mycobacterium sp. 1274761.0]